MEWQALDARVCRVHEWTVYVPGHFDELGLDFWEHCFVHGKQR
jgi:hypothetical protein